MEIKTKYELFTKIDESIAWRRKEIIELRSWIQSTSNPVFTRAGIALLSAHFEGFIREAANYYLLYICSLKKDISELQSNFRTMLIKHKLGGKIKDCSDSNMFAIYDELLNKLDDLSSKKFFYKYDEEKLMIVTESNPSSEVFKNIVSSIGLDYKQYETKRNYIDSDLLSNRHQIVHGHKIEISKDDFESTYTQIFHIMDEFKDSIYEAVTKYKYRKS